METGNEEMEYPTAGQTLWKTHSRELITLPSEYKYNTSWPPWLNCHSCLHTRTRWKGFGIPFRPIFSGGMTGVELSSTQGVWHFGPRWTSLSQHLSPWSRIFCEVKTREWTTPRITKPPCPDITDTITGLFCDHRNFATTLQLVINLLVQIWLLNIADRIVLSNSQRGVSGFQQFRLCTRCRSPLRLCWCGHANGIVCFVVESSVGTPSALAVRRDEGRTLFLWKWGKVKRRVFCTSRPSETRE